MKLKNLAVLLIALCAFCVRGGGLTFSASPAFADYKTKITLTINSSSSGGGDDGTYIIVIPGALNITAIGWNPFEDGISIKTTEGHTFSADKQLSITASSDNNWQLMLSPDKAESIGYTLTTAEGGSQIESLTFSAASIDAGVSQDLGVIVGNYAGNTAGTYEDTITFTVTVETAVSPKITITDFNGRYDEQTFNYTEGWKWQDMLNAYPDSFSVIDGSNVGITVNGTTYHLYYASLYINTSDVVSNAGTCWYYSSEYDEDEDPEPDLD